jgi:hypothetical protein
VTDAPEGSPNSNIEASRNGRPVLGRRGFVLAGAPIILTLANRTAHATGGGGGFVCSMSILASANLSNPIERNANCGVSPGCWKHNAHSDSMWQSTGIDPATPIGSVPGLNPPGDGEVGKWTWKYPNLSIHGSLTSGANKLGFRKGDSTYWWNSGGGDVTNLIAGFLNVKAFASGNYLFGMQMIGHYPVDPAELTIALNALFNPPNPTSSGEAAARILACKNAIYQVEDASHFCDPEM